MNTTHLRRLGLPDHFVLHAEREEQLAEVGLDLDGITASTLDLARTLGLASDAGSSSTSSGGRRVG